MNDKLLFFNMLWSFCSTSGTLQFSELLQIIEYYYWRSWLYFSLQSSMKKFLCSEICENIGTFFVFMSKSNLLLSIDLALFQRLVSSYGHKSAPAICTLKAGSNHVDISLTKQIIYKMVVELFCFVLFLFVCFFLAISNVSLYT